MKVNGIEYELNLLDADVAERIEEAAQALADDFSEKIEELKSTSASKSIREQCRMIDVFFDTVLGEGAAVAVFGGKYDLEAHLDAYGQFMDDLTKERDQRLAAASSRLAERIPVPKPADQA